MRPVPGNGPAPWRQTQWDARAAANFACGGAGGGLIAFTAIAQPSSGILEALVLAGLALVGAGLTAVWFELGRPWRALNVFRNLRTSWMTREALAGSVLFATGLGAVLGIPGGLWAAGAAALLFIYCQARMLQAAKGIPAWREPTIVPLLVASALAEGGGLFWLAAPWHREGSLPLLIVFGALVILRLVAWLVYRRALVAAATPVLAALAPASVVLLAVGTLLPLGLCIVVAAAPSGGPILLALTALAGLAALGSGTVFKFALVLRASYNQGFVLARLPVRGTRR